MATPPDPIDIAAIQEPEAPPQAADDRTLDEENSLDKQERLAHISGLLQDISERKVYANRIYCLIEAWLIGMFFLLFMQGICHGCMYRVSDDVLMAAIGGTTLNVIGIFLVVARYLFPQRPSIKP